MGSLRMLLLADAHRQLGCEMGPHHPGWPANPVHLHSAAEHIFYATPLYFASWLPIMIVAMV
jgi:hypothetical protein